MPDSAPLIAQAVRHLKAGRPGEAIPPLRRAAAMHPANPTILHDLGLACLETGALAESIAALRQAIALNPKYTDAYFRLGRALEQAGDIHGAIIAYDRATELLPTLSEAWYRAGSLVFGLGFHEEAVGCFRRAAATGPKTKFGRLGRARALLAEERDREAEQVLRQMLTLDDKDAVAYDLLGNILADAGRFDEARDCFMRAIANAPLMAGSYYDLVRCRRVVAEEADLLRKMRDALAAPGLETEQRIRLHLALGKAADDLGDHAVAMQEFDAADMLRRELVSFDADEFDRLVDRVIERFTPESIAPTERCSDETPVLIIGMPRSGTTLTEQIISCHALVEAGGELNYWNERGTAWVKAGALPLDASSLEALASSYRAILHAKSSSAARVTDKMPFNFLWAGLIHSTFPRATILHCRRSAIDTALSIHQTYFNTRLAFPTGGTELVRYLNAYERLTAYWRRVLPQDRFIEIDYEELTRTPEPVIRRIVAACGLPWDGACLRPELNPRAVKTASRWQARQAIHRNAVERWRHYEPWLGSLGALLAR